MRNLTSARSRNPLSNTCNPALQQGQPIAAFPFTGTWVDLGTRERYVQFRERLQSGAVDLAEFLALALAC